MIPYYADDLVTIYHGDGPGTLDWLGAHGGLDAAVLVTDPPYGTGAYATDRRVFGYVSLQEAVNTFRSVAVFGWPEELVKLCGEAQRWPCEWIVWWPTNAEVKGRFAQVPCARDSEHIAVFGDLREARGAPVTGLGRAYAGRGNRAKHHVSAKGKRWGDVWRDSSPGLAFQRKLRNHPNEKPVSLMVRLLGLVADGLVADPFAGSGSTLVAAKQLGRRAIGIEVEERWCEVAAQRCSQEVLGLSA